MILPAKHIAPSRSLIGIGAEILRLLEQPRSVSEIWSALKAQRENGRHPLTFDWFVLALTWLYAISAIHEEGGHIYREGD